MIRPVRALFFPTILAACVAFSGAAGAARYRIDTRTSALLYPVVGRDGVVVADQQILQTRLRFRVDDVLPVEEADGDRLHRPDIAADLSLRLFGNLGLAAGTTDPASSSYVPRVDAFSPDILFAFVEATDLFDGWVDVLQAGRFVHSTVLGWNSDDGALARIGFEEWVHLQLVGGLENVPGLLLSASPFAPEGVERWSADGAGADAYRRRNEDGRTIAPREPEYRPAFQITADGDAGPVGYEVGYRHTWLSGEGDAARQLFGARLDGGFDPVSLYGALRLDVAAVEVADADVEMNLRFGEGRHRVGLQYDYFRPTFDLDSIFWVFAADPFHEVTAKYRFPLLGPLSGQVWGTLRRVEDVQGLGDAEPVAGPFSDLGGGLGLTLRRSSWDVTARWKVMRGSATNLAAFDLTGRARVVSWCHLWAVGSVWQYEDRVRDRYRGLGGAGRIGGSFDVLPDWIALDGDFQIAHDPREGTTFAGFVWIDLGVTL